MITDPVLRDRLRVVFKKHGFNFADGYSYMRTILIGMFDTFAVASQKDPTILPTIKLGNLGRFKPMVVKNYNTAMAKFKLKYKERLKHPDTYKKKRWKNFLQGLHKPTQ